MNEQKPTNNYDRTSFILGILAIIFCWNWGGAVLGTLGIVFSFIGLRKGVENEKKLGIGLGLSIASISILIVCCIILYGLNHWNI